MSFNKCIKIFSLIIFCSLFLTSGNFFTDKVIASTNTTSATVTTQQNAVTVKPLMLVANPKAYLNKTITFNAQFDKFSTLGLDYKSAFKSSDDYISFLIKRDDTTHNIPLSELKLFLKRDYAEKFIDLKNSDEIKVQGIVFSDALGDAWVEVNNLSIVKKAPENKDNGVEK